MGLALKQCLGCAAPLGEGLTCEHCGARHRVAGEGFALSCGRCGDVLPPGAACCPGCRAPAGIDCPECRARTPAGGRFCQGCGLELAAYRRARRGHLPVRHAGEAAGERARAWLGSGWFRARDQADHLRLIDRELLWAPVWRLRARVEGTLLGEVARTHYRTTTVDGIGPDGQPTQRVVSRPYEVMEQVERPVAEALDERAAASPDARELDDLVLAAGPARVEAAPLEGPALPGDAAGRLFAPRGDDEAAFTALRARALEGLAAARGLRVEQRRLQVLDLRFELAFHPVWRLVWRYRRAHGVVRVHATTGDAAGDRPSLLAQWFS